MSRRSRGGPSWRRSCTSSGCAPGSWMSNDVLRGSAEHAGTGGWYMTAEQQSQLSEAQIAVHWREGGDYTPPAALIGAANASDPAIFDRVAAGALPECFREDADLLDWDTHLPPTPVT